MPRHLGKGKLLDATYDCGADSLPNRTDPDDPGQARDAVIDLAHEAPFALGATRVRPAHCEVTAQGQKIRLQPRVMQVLVALHKARGEMVSRDELAARCWGGVVVGDDALNRCIQRLRRLSQEESSGDFTIKTLPRVGYRLYLGEGSEAPPAEPAADSTGGRMRMLPVAALALIGGLAAAWAWTSRPSTWVVLDATRRIATPLNERHPAISPDGKMIAYAAGADVLSRKIYLADIAGGDPIELAHNDGADDSAPAWSPDGRRILYVSSRPGEPCRLMLVDAPAGTPREVARCRTEGHTRPVWTPRGDGVLFADRNAINAPGRIVGLSLDDGRRRDITKGPADLDDYDPEISPDGRWMMFERDAANGQVRLIVHSLTGGKEREVAQIPLGSGYAWSSDSRTIFLSRNTGLDSEIEAVPRGGGKGQQLMTFPMTTGRMASGPGGLLAVEIYAGWSQPATPGAGDGAPPVILDSGGGSSWSFDFSPSGDLAFVSDRSRSNALWLLKRGEAARQVISFGQSDASDVVWAPDGQRLAMISTLNARNAIRVVSLSGEQLAEIQLDKAQIGSLAWTGDGHELVYSVRDGANWRLWRLDPANPKSARPITGEGWVDAISHGSDLYALKSDLSGVWNLTTSKEVAALPRDLQATTDHWKMTSGALIVGRPGPNRRLELVSIPFDGGAPRIFGELVNSLMNSDFTVDPKTGKPVYAARVGENSDIEVLRVARR